MTMEHLLFRLLYFILEFEKHALSAMCPFGREPFRRCALFRREALSAMCPFGREPFRHCALSAMCPSGSKSKPLLVNSYRTRTVFIRKATIAT